MGDILEALLLPVALSDTGVGSKVSDHWEVYLLKLEVGQYHSQLKVSLVMVSLASPLAQTSPFYQVYLVQSTIMHQAKVVLISTRPHQTPHLHVVPVLPLLQSKYFQGQSCLGLFLDC